MARTSNTPKPLKISIVQAKYTGHEPTWDDFDETQRKRQVMWAFNWYNYHFGAKESREMLIDYLTANGASGVAKKVAKLRTYAIPNAIGWLARMSRVGYPINDDEKAQISEAICKAVDAHVEVKEEKAEAKPASNKPTIQDRMRERAAETGGELEHALDQFIKGGAKANHGIKPIDILKRENPMAQHVPMLIEAWEATLAEFKLAQQGDDEVAEYYGGYNKIQLRNLVKFAELVVADLNSYIAFKKANKAPRKRKQKTPEQLAARLKYLKAFKDGKLDLKSVKPAKIVGATEMFVYSTRKRKLMYFVADEHAGGQMTIRNNTIEGFDAAKSCQKTVRKPQEQIKEFMSASKPRSRKFFKEIKSVEQKFSGRFADDLVILKVW